MSQARDERVFAAADSLRDFMSEHLAASKVELEAKWLFGHSVGVMG